jgi:hypothetical protein
MRAAYYAYNVTGQEKEVKVNLQRALRVPRGRAVLTETRLEEHRTFVVHNDAEVSSVATVDRFEVVAEYHDLVGMRFFFDEIRVPNPAGR